MQESLLAGPLQKINSKDDLKVEVSLSQLTDDFLLLLTQQLNLEFVWMLSGSQDNSSQIEFSWVDNSLTVHTVKLGVASDFLQFLMVLNVDFEESANKDKTLPKSVIQLLPNLLQRTLACAPVMSILNTGFGAVRLLGSVSRALSSTEHRLMELAVENYKGNIENFRSTLSAKGLIDSLDTAIMYCDFQSLGNYASRLKELTPEALNKHLSDNKSELDSLITRNNLIYVNHACTRLFNAQSEDRLYRLFICYFKKQLPHFIETVVNALKSSNRNLKYPFSFTDHLGWEVHISMRLKIPLRLEKFSQVSVSFDDITEQVTVENEIKETLLRYQLVVKGAYGAIWDWNITEGTVHYSPQWRALRGYGEDELDNSQEHWINSIHPEDKEQVIQALNDYFNGHSHVFEKEYRIIRKDSSVRWVVDRGIGDRDESGTVVRMAGSEFDITEKRRSDDRLRLAASVFESAAESIIILNTQRLIIDSNAAFRKLLGATKKQVKGQPLEKFSYDKEQLSIYTLIWKELLNKGTWQGEVWKKHTSGKRIPTWLTISEIKDNLGEVTHYAGLMTDISHVKNTEEAMYQLAHHDSLTGLPNRLLLNERLQKAIHNSQINSSKFAVMYIDLDNFKYVNDGLGHAVGDELLKEVAVKLTSVTRRSDTVARTSGDEFVVLLEREANQQTLIQVAEKFLKQLNEQVLLSGHTVRASASIGIAIFPQDGADSNTLVSNADAAMYRAKALGRQGYQFYSQELTQIAKERMQLDSELHQAIANNQLFLLYQPKYSLKTNRLTGFEALVRWEHPVLGLIGPDKFIPVAEETSFIVDIGAWVIEEACYQADSWRQQGFKFENIAVNVSCKQLLTGNLQSIIASALTKYHLPAKCLEVEITESVIMLQPKDAIRQLEQLRDLGISLSIDDFGTGYSSLSQLKEMPINNLKIDKSFIHNISTNKNDNVITETILAMAERLGLKVIAEGVEVAEQEDFLRIKQCDEVQGYLFNRPKKPSDISELDLFIGNL